jgi:integrase
MLQAMKLVPLPLVTTPSEEVKEYVSELGLTDSRRFEVLRVVNELMAFLNKPKIENPRPVHREEVTYVPKDVFLAKLPELPEPYQLYLASLYATGCRFAELPKVTVEGDWAFVARQIHPNGQEWVTKNGKKRHTPILPELKPFIMAFKALPEKTQATLRLEDYNRLYGACTRLYGHSIHTLRHSFAITCALEGRTVEEIAGWIGDTVEVTRKHYLGYIRPGKSPWAK